MPRTKTEQKCENEGIGKRRQRTEMPRMKLGQTIVAERERVESDSERMRARRAQRRKRWTAVVVVILMVLILGGLLWMGVRQLLDTTQQETVEPSYEIQAEVVDEDNTGQVSERVKSYIAQLEQDVADLGYKVTRVTLPTGTSRELYVDLEGIDWYFRVTIDRDTAVTAEDMERMIRYLQEQGLNPGYVDVRVEGKAFYK